MLSRDEMRQFVLAARLYYDEEKNQAEIARHLGVSRPKVSRMLQRAREEGIVQITILDPLATDADLAATLCEATGLRRVVVVPGAVSNIELMRARLGLAGARFLEETLRPSDILGVGWGRSLQAVASTLAARPRRGLIAVPLLGGLGQIAPSFQVQELTRRMAESFGGSWRQLYVPAIVEDDAARAQLLASPDLSEVMQDWARLTTAVVGIGDVDFDSEIGTLFANYLDAETQRRLRSAGAVGDLCMRFFDRHGRPIADGLRGVIGINLEQLRATPNVIAVAGGANKAEAILGAVRGEFIDTLVTDEAAARAVLKIVRTG